MIYLLDLFFTIGYLMLRRVFKTMHDDNISVFMSLRSWIGWAEFAYVLLWLYIIPKHSITEGTVSFFMCMMTKAAFQYIIKTIK